jgi:hypothetical protein
MSVSRDKATLKNMSTLIQQHPGTDDDSVETKVSDPEPFKFVAIPSISEHTATVILFHVSPSHLLTSTVIDVFINLWNRAWAGQATP